MKKSKNGSVFIFSQTNMIKYFAVGIILISVGLIIGNSDNKKSTDVVQELAFEKDEYCRKTYADSFVNDYKEKLIGYKGHESEYMKLIDIFYSPTKNECYAVYDYYYINSDPKWTDLSMFEKRIARAVSADSIIETYYLGISGYFKNGKDEAIYQDMVRDLKGR